MARTKTWRERIARARVRPGFLAEDRARASRWSTCAVGETLRCRGLKVARLPSGCPVGAKLRRLGTAFFAAVLANDVARAECTLAEIEDHVLGLAARHASDEARPTSRPATRSARAVSGRGEGDPSAK